MFVAAILLSLGCEGDGMNRFAAEIVPESTAIAQLTERASAFLRGNGVDARATHHVALVVEELLTNFATHGALPAAPATVVVTVEAGRVAGEIRHAGAPFDPLTVPAPDVTLPLDERLLGGLGLLLVRRLTSELHFRHENDVNRVSFAVLREEGQGQVGEGG
jgi:anti-sigma regulatory factor (Ser/Thr protein kinase)